MRRLAAVEAEVVRRLDQAAAEVIVPQPVDDRPGEQRVVLAGDPLGQFAPAVGVGGIRRQAEIGRCLVRASDARRRQSVSPAAVALPRTSRWATGAACGVTA